ncbi:MAG: hypothetical protein H0W76_02525 [Pyrinomonadaceae bacterium]|nr:hypothetical protein [Pyrinomonadaceae bacterium]
MSALTLSGFLAAFYPDEHEPVHLRAEESTAGCSALLRSEDHHDAP